jgi:hypothetical protein
MHRGHRRCISIGDLATQGPAIRALQRTTLPRLPPFSLSTIQTATGASTDAHAAERKPPWAASKNHPPHAHGGFPRARSAPTRQRPSGGRRQCNAQDQSCRRMRNLSFETRQGWCSVHFASRWWKRKLMHWSATARSPSVEHAVPRRPIASTLHPYRCSPDSRN